MLDLDGNGSYTGTDELDETRTQDVVNEILTRDTDLSAPAEYTLTHDAVGNLTDDGQTWKYKWDAFGCLVKLTNQSHATLAESTCFGNNFRASEHYDTHADLDVDSNDHTYYFAWDEGWRLAAVYRGSRVRRKSQSARPTCAGNRLPMVERTRTRRGQQALAPA
jgi:YD repeat-containing protein